MRFWDSSAIIPLCFKEKASEATKALLKADEDLVVWWTTRIECFSAISRRQRERTLSSADELGAEKHSFRSCCGVVGGSANRDRSTKGRETSVDSFPEDCGHVAACSGPHLGPGKSPGSGVCLPRSKSLIIVHPLIERTAQWEPAFLGDPLPPMVISVASTAFEIAASEWTLLRSRTAKIQFSSLARFPCHDFRIATLRAWPRFFSSFRWAIHRIFHSNPP